MQFKLMPSVVHSTCFEPWLKGATTVRDEPRLPTSCGSIQQFFGAINMISHVTKDIRVGTIDGYAARGDFSINCPMDNVTMHQERILSCPIPGRIEVTSFQRIETRLNAIKIGIAMVASNAV